MERGVYMKRIIYKGFFYALFVCLCVTMLSVCTLAGKEAQRSAGPCVVSAGSPEKTAGLEVSGEPKVAEGWETSGEPVLPDSCSPQDSVGQLYAGAAVLMDGASGRVLYTKNGNAPMAMASTTKIMTCILVLENGNPDDCVEVSAYAASMPKVKLYAKKGETYRVKDLLYSLMLESHNDSAVILAEYIGNRVLNTETEVKNATQEQSRQAVAAFAGLMNRKAEEIGCEDTYFITPNGLDATETFETGEKNGTQMEHHTTAKDLAKIMSYCILQSEQKEEFLAITKTPSYHFSANQREYDCNNHNAFLTMMDGAISGKTGFTNKAGYCYVGALNRENRIFVVSLLACGWPNHKTYKWSDTRKLMEYGIQNYSFRSFLEKGVAYDENRLRPIPVKNGQVNELGQKAYTMVEIIGREDGGNVGLADVSGSMDTGNKQGVLMRDDEKIQVCMQVKKELDAPIKAGTPVGEVTYGVDDTIYRREIIVTSQNVERIDFFWCIWQIWKRFSFFPLTV